MILGVGIDIVEVARVQRSWEKFGDRFLQRVFCRDEIDYCLKFKSPGPFLAARFAAKEAVSKAFGTGIGARLGWKDVEVAHLETGKPRVILHGGGETLLRERSGSAMHLSISHTANHAAVIAIWEAATELAHP